MKSCSTFIWAILCALATGLAGCAAPPLAGESAQSRADLADQDNHLSSALRHLQQAHDRLAAQSQSTSDVDAGAIDVRAAAADAAKVRQDVQNLSSSASSLQEQIDKHRNDLLGPRARRIRNRVIALMILLGIGAALLRLGPLFGGPVGGAVVVVGHVLTACVVPIWYAAEYGLGLAWSGGVALVGWIVSKLESLGNGSKASTSPAAVSTGGAIHAAAGSD